MTIIVTYSSQSIVSKSGCCIVVQTRCFSDVWDSRSSTSDHRESCFQAKINISIYCVAVEDMPWARDCGACVLCVLWVVGLFSAVGGPRWRYITANASQAWRAHHVQRFLQPIWVHHPEQVFWRNQGSAVHKLALFEWMMLHQAMVAWTQEPACQVQRLAAAIKASSTELRVSCCTWRRIEIGHCQGHQGKSRRRQTLSNSKITCSLVPWVPCWSCTW